MRKTPAPRRNPPWRARRVAVGVVVLRNTHSADAAEVLLIRRLNPPSNERLCFPGGRVEWGETLAQAARREVLEETGVPIRVDGAAAARTVVAAGLEHPWPLTVVDGIYPGADGAPEYHYAIVEARRFWRLLSLCSIGAHGA